MYRKPLIFVVISALFVALFYQSALSNVFALPPSPKFGAPGSDCSNNVEKLTATCCWDEVVYTGEGGGQGFETVTRCQTCNINTDTGDFVDCTPVSRESTVGGPFAQPGFPFATPGGVFQSQPAKPVVPPGNVGTLQNQSAAGGPFATPDKGGVLNTPQTGGVFNALPSPTDEGTTGAPSAPPVNEGTQAPTLTEEPAPVCPEGQVLDEQTNLCVLEESDESGEETEQQSSEEDSSEDNDNDDSEDDDENN